MESLTVGQAAARTGWSPRMLRYLERAGLVIPARSPSGYRLYGLPELNQLRSLSDLRRRFGVGIDELAFTIRLQQEPALQAAVETWLANAFGLVTALDWEQRKHERLLAA
jgi:MerR family transcriptional regulator, copper efflux regulator